MGRLAMKQIKQRLIGNKYCTNVSRLIVGYLTTGGSVSRNCRLVNYPRCLVWGSTTLQQRFDDVTMTLLGSQMQCSKTSLNIKAKYNNNVNQAEPLREISSP